MKPATLLLLGLAGNRTDRLRTALTALGTALAVVALMSAATVAAIQGGDWVAAPGGGLTMAPGSDRYASPLLVEAGLRVGVIITLVLLALPVLALAGQCIRLGAPARDRRLAAIRLAGATPRQAVLIASAETTVAGALGSLAGLGVFLLLRVVLDSRTASGQLRLPTDVLPAPAVIVAILLLVPVLAGLVGALLLRRVIISPTGVVHHTREGHPLPWPGVLIIGGVVLFAVPLQVDGDFSNRVVLLCLGGGVVLTIVGTILGTGWISYTSGRLLRRFGRRPAMLLAGRRLMADPWNGSRTQAALLAGVITGAGAIGYRQFMISDFEAYDRLNALAGATDGTGIGYAAAPDFYLGAVRLVLIAVFIGMAVAAAGVLIALAESIVARRRSYAALTAVGVPRGVLSESVLWHTFAPLLPAVLISLAAGGTMSRMFGTTITKVDTLSQCRGTAAQCATGDPQFVESITRHQVVLAVPVPWDGLALIGGVAVTAVLLAVGASLLVLRASTDVEELRAG